ncbi:hypothetical protein BW247_07830 [Acidihalobacter ferrooxydans]|uniref:Chemotaxis protein n=2 Tax=Acidihalobacter ferrooxydans TaxID=1765967 RepID=A0A1P8UGV3_9GAMM|nr:hypothetical protein BW247_07830 [Acidihalobacter ferrooxydans]
MNLQSLMTLVENTHHTRHRVNRALRDIDRRALNAMVLVKRHGNALAGYGVIAGAFRDQAAKMQTDAQRLQQAVAPLVEASMRVMQYRLYGDMVGSMLGKTNRSMGQLAETQALWQQQIKSAEKHMARILVQLLKDVERFQEAIAEQEYVVTNGRIEAALSENTGAPLTRVSREMGQAVGEVRETIDQWKNTLEEFTHESRTGL